jgi:hypothetical protein
MGSSSSSYNQGPGSGTGDGSGSVPGVAPGKMMGPREKPDAQEVNDLLKAAITEASAAGLFDKLSKCHKTRRMYWEGQTGDGLLPAVNKLPKDRMVFTWPGAPDTGIPWADEVVEEHAMIRKSVWDRGEMRLGPREVEETDGSGDEDKASGWQTALELMLDQQKRRMRCHLGLFDTCIEEFGYGGVHVGRRKSLRTVKVKVTEADLLQVLVEQQYASVMAQLQEGGTPEGEPQMAQMAQMEVPPEVMAQIQVQAQQVLEEMLLEKGEGRLQELLLAWDPSMPKTEARWAAKDLKRAMAGREVEGEGQGPGQEREPGEVAAWYYAPQDDGFQPYTRALVPFVNWIHGMDLTGAGETWWVGLPERLCAADVRARAAVERWDEEFTEKVLSHPNEFLNSGQTWEGRVPSWVLSGAAVEMDSGTVNQEDPFYEVVYMVRRMADAQGRVMVYETLVHPKEDDCVGYHVCTGLSDLPLVVECREDVLYAVLSRGIPEIALVAGQAAMKTLVDAEGARSQLASNPPWDSGLEERRTMKPGLQIFNKRRSDGESKFLAVPQADQGTLAMLDRLEGYLNKRFFRDTTTDPDMKRLYREGLALSSAESIRAVLVLMWKVMQGSVSTMKASRIAGRLVNLDLDRDSMQGEVDVAVYFNVDGLSTDASDKTMEWGVKLLQVDPGNVDRAELVNIVARLKDPAMAKRIILPAEEMAQRVTDQENNRIAQMVAGVPMRYEERVSAPQLRLEVLEQWLQDPVNVQRMAQDPEGLGKRIQDEHLYLSRQIQQYQENAVTGRTLMAEGQRVAG